MEFKKECFKKGLVENYKSVSEFREKFRNQLTMKIIKHEYFHIDNSAEIVNQQTSTQINEPLFDLSDEAKELLIEAAASQDGVVIRIETLGSFTIKTNNKTFVEQGNPRSKAAWVGAIKQLCQYDLLEEQGDKGTIFNVTHEGYQLAEQLKEQ